MEGGETQNNPIKLTELRPPESFAAIEPLRQQTDRIKFFETVTDLATEFALENPHIWPAGVTKDQAMAVLKEKNFPEKPEDTDPHNKERYEKLYKNLLSVGRLKERIARRMIKKTLEGENHLDLSETEKTVLLASCELGEHFDEFSMQWREKIQNEPEETAALLAQEPHDYLYVIGKKDEDTDTVSLVSYAETFPQPIGAIKSTIDNLVASLETIKTPDDAEKRNALIAYYAAFRDAITETDHAEHKEKFTKVDALWMHIPGAMQPIHMVETIGDPKSKRVAPDYTLVFREDNPLNHQMDTMKQPLINAINAIYASPFLNEQSLGGVFVSAMQSGMRLDVSPAAQFLPERHEVRLAEGVKTFINFDNIEKIRPYQNTLLHTVFGEQVTNISDEELNKTRALFTNGHEIAHSAFMKPETRHHLGEHYEQLEEVKSDIGTLAVMPDFVPDAQQQDAMLMSLLSASLMYLKDAKERNLPRFYNSGAAVLRTMLDAGVIHQDEDSFTLDLSADKKVQLFAKAKEVAGKLAAVYDASPDKMQQKANVFEEKYCADPADNEPLKALADKLAPNSQS